MQFVRFIFMSLRSPKLALSRVKGLCHAVVDSLRHVGLIHTCLRAARFLRTRGLSGVLRYQPILVSLGLPRSLPPVNRDAIESLGCRVLIIAETSIPQCTKYRVTQKQQMVGGLGYPCTVLSWTDLQACTAALQTHSIIIFYRVPAYPQCIQLVEEARRLRARIYWEVDDLIFNEEKYSLNSNLKELSEDMVRQLLEGARLYREMLIACGAGIASTEGIAQEMREIGIKDVWVINNALDRETLDAVDALLTQGKPRNDSVVRIGYGSGTKTHDADFRCAANAIIQILRANPQVRLRIVGELNLPAEFVEFVDQIERFPLAAYSDYLRLLSECDISIAPLEPSIFNDAKSNIKFLEAGVLSLPSVCSPRSAFRDVVLDGANGYLADNQEEWRLALQNLVTNPELRSKIGAAAKISVLSAYMPAAIAQTSLAPLLERRPTAQATRNKLRVLQVNIFFEPRSFGGATVVAEELTALLSNTLDTDVCVFTALPVDKAPPYQLVRYEAKNTMVFGMGLPYEADKTKEFENPSTLTPFLEVLAIFKPDVVHLHSVQGLGALMAEACKFRGIPFVVTLHDAWWICGRQFMITGKKKYCHQTTIDLAICDRCVENPKLNRYRQKRLSSILQKADLLLVPSAFFKQLYAQNGFAAEQIVVHKNGIRPPVETRKLPATKLRLGYVGGNTEIKGIHVIKHALNGLSTANYELILVDNLLNLGEASMEPAQFRLAGDVQIVPAYTQKNIDQFFARIDVLLFPTQWKESFGLTVREALVRDVWVIATDAGGVTEDIVVGENGDIISLDDDGTQLRAAIERLVIRHSRGDLRPNPYKHHIRLFPDQAAELKEHLQQLAQHIPIKRI
ncbi:glycosyltransferase [Silvimonas soli]|uniref:glycosyltransferase n=1 Tax=Silvimonas soli TaxID=2980100 RepID=UPI0024B35761|nr:glycosyltransferase [Silvimonas soli]